MFLSKEELKDVMLAYEREGSIEKDHYEVGPDTWFYLFEHKDKKYILVTTDYLGDYDFDSFPHTLSFDSIFCKNKFLTPAYSFQCNSHYSFNKLILFCNP